MIWTMGLTTDDEFIYDFPVQEISGLSLQWYWVDFDQPDAEEASLLQSLFAFHPLALEDCYGRIQRPKLDHYEGYTFFALHSICHEDLIAEEVDLFLGENFIISFHYTQLQEIDKAREAIMQDSRKWERGHVHVMYEIMDKIVDQYFPILYNIEDHLDEIEEKLSPTTVQLSMEYVFEVRGDLLRLRRTIYPMRELLYRMLESKRLDFIPHEHTYFSDIYDHLIRLSDMIDSNRQLTSDIRDSQLSINSNQMNSVMMTLTIISSVFIPLTFIAGVYGMNFDRMPELHFQYGYPVVLIVMLIIGIAMIGWFTYKGWFRINKT
ncbi:magnesium/cobalt transporter CorA [Sporosarcina sp. Marseille-Q4943]|uniref:magnesium/cobalt transporter CorA n=1 Tax=Sporosarcina sp. Marseille-Q4943 TaxID=2942204 RepID=UPI00208DB69A|nr:magnesium/cobalt transporter CorA [Sporosarcina sp. Marseille-Q4943]